MEADWGVEIGPSLPEIHVPWEGFVDLRHAPAKLQVIPEAARFPALARALAALNRDGSPVFTAKSDVWDAAQEEIDPYEFAALPEDALYGTASYVDLLERDPANLASFDFHECVAKALATDMRGLPVRNGRVDLVIRAATVDDREGYGITLYAAGCGADPAAALAAWEAVLAAAVLATIGAAGRDFSQAAHAGE